MKVQAIIPSAGAGVRFKGATLKPLTLLDGKPVIVYTLAIFEQCPSVASLILVAGKERLHDFENLVKEFGFSKVVKVVAGGATRADSVKNGLKALDENTQLVMIHDGVRPLVTPKMVEELIALGKTFPAATVGVPVKPTIKSVNAKDMTVKETLDRSALWETQTPQIFKKDIIIKAHKSPKKETPTDDAALVESLGVPVKILMGDYRNIKITTQEDLVYAKALRQLQ